MATRAPDYPLLLAECQTRALAWLDGALSFEAGSGGGEREAIETAAAYATMCWLIENLAIGAGAEAEADDGGQDTGGDD